MITTGRCGAESNSLRVVNSLRELTTLARIAHCPHRARPGGAWVCAPWRGFARRSPPTGLAPVGRRFLHKNDGHPFSAPTGLAPVERGLTQQTWEALNRLAGA